MSQAVWKGLKSGPLWYRLTQRITTLRDVTAARDLCSNSSKSPSSQLIEPLVNDSSHKIVVFMKGNPDAPRCGFSNAVVQILRMHGVKYASIDVLGDENIRQGVKDYTSWPTIPQIFFNGEFVGGCDILLQMHKNGELVDELKKIGIESQLAAEAADTDTHPK